MRELRPVSQPRGTRLIHGLAASIAMLACGLLWTISRVEPPQAVAEVAEVAEVSEVAIVPTATPAPTVQPTEVWVDIRRVPDTFSGRPPWLDLQHLPVHHDPALGFLPTPDRQATDPENTIMLTVSRGFTVTIDPMPVNPGQPTTPMPVNPGQPTTPMPITPTPQPEAPDPGLQPTPDEG